MDLPVRAVGHVAFDRKPLYAAASGTRLISSYRIDKVRMAVVYEFPSFGANGSMRTLRNALRLSSIYRGRAHSLGAMYTFAGDLSRTSGTGATQVSSRYGYLLSNSVELYAQYTAILNRSNGNYGDGLNTSTGPGVMLSGFGTGLAFSFYALLECRER